MNLLSPQERERYLEFLSKELQGKKLKNTEIVVCPPFVHIESFVKSVGKKVRIGSQNIFWEEKGAYTGETSPVMLKNIKAQYAIIGHSERRRYFGETNETINLKLKSALRAGLTPIFCVGETKEEKGMDMTMDVIVRQIQEGLKDISRVLIEKIVIVYEPVWAVGSDVIPTSNEIMGAKLLIRKILTEKYGAKYVEKIRVIYGGSVNAKWAKQVCVDPEMDGVLVGRESLVPHEFVKIASIING